MQKMNERAWAGQIISWIKETITAGETIFEDATNDEGIKLKSGRTKFPDILLFIDKISGIVFNGWELKFPDTPVDDREMLFNALEKAERLNSNSFVTWNGAEAIIWKIEGEYSIKNLSKLKVYPKEQGINRREDLSDKNMYLRFEYQLKQRLKLILHDLEQLYQNEEIKEAVNISLDIIIAISEVSKKVLPQIENQIFEFKGKNKYFRTEFAKWKILESSTLKILENSSRRVENVVPELVLAKFTFYKLIGKILFYLTLSENLSGGLAKFDIETSDNLKQKFENYFNKAKEIDYQAVFNKDFTDELLYNPTIEKLLFTLIEVLNRYDFKILPTEVIGNILENLVPKEEKQKFGQYFTSETLSNLVAFPAIQSQNDIVFDPTSGTGTFLNTFYNVLKFNGQKDHQTLLTQIWGNDISHFPAVLSVINLYKQKVSDVANFPRITRSDYFNLHLGQIIEIPDNKDINKINKVKLPQFDAIVSNFPFIQQEDIPNKWLTDFFREEFQEKQKAFLKDKKFVINERSDYYTYCFYNSLKYLKPDGIISAITSNAWLGKNYGQQFKRFILDNFSIKYIVKSNAEHWFTYSQVSTIFLTIQKNESHQKTKFVTLNFKLNNYFTEENKAKHIEITEEIYNQIDFCDLHENVDWQQDKYYKTVYHKKDNSITVSIVDNEKLIEATLNQDNWDTFFIAQNPLSIFEKSVINPFPELIDVGRGTRTGQDKMFLLNQEQIDESQIEDKFLQPTLKSSRDLDIIENNVEPETFLFLCYEPIDKLKNKYPNAYKWIKKWETAKNKVGKPLQQVLKANKPNWYSLKAEEPANIYISINPDKKLFFSYSNESIHLNQRLVAIRADQKDVEIMAALFNSIIGLLYVEFNGISRNLGALDLNADFFKTKMKILNPKLLTKKQKDLIISKFKPLTNRIINNYNLELQSKDRIDFDKTVLKCYGYDDHIITFLYSLLIDKITNRIEMKNR